MANCGTSNVICSRPACDLGWPFNRVDIYPKIAGGTLVSWTLRRGQRLPDETEFRLYAGFSPAVESGEWTLVDSDVDTYSLTDTRQREFGAYSRLNYYLAAIIDDVVYPSLVYPVRFGRANSADWSTAQEILRQERLAIRANSRRPGVLFKRRWEGPACTHCRDPDSGAVLDSNCPVCFGTGFTGGYYSPKVCAYATKTPYARDWKESEQYGYAGGTLHDVFRLVYLPLIEPGDIWVSQETDERWEILKVRPVVSVGPLVIIQEVEAVLRELTSQLQQLTSPRNLPSL